MGRKSKSMIAMQAELVSSARSDLQVVPANLTPALQEVVAEIDALFGDIQVASLTSFWRIGKLISDVQAAPERFLTPEQQASHVDGGSLIVSIFAPVYTAEQLRGAVNFFDKYPSEDQINRLLTLRCPDRPRWRLTTSHVQLLAQIPDQTQRESIETKCAEEAYTARALANELHEIRGKQKNGGRSHQAPKGLKQQVFDLLQHQRRFIARSESLWLNEKKDNIYDDIANASSAKLSGAVMGYFKEITQNFETMSDIVADHVAMCAKIQQELDRREQSDDGEDYEDTTGHEKLSSDIIR